MSLAIQTPDLSIIPQGTPIRDAITIALAPHKTVDSIVRDRTDKLALICSQHPSDFLSAFRQHGKFDELSPLARQQFIELEAITAHSNFLSDDNLFSHFIGIFPEWLGNIYGGDNPLLQRYYTLRIGAALIKGDKAIDYHRISLELYQCRQKTIGGSLFPRPSASAGTDVPRPKIEREKSIAHADYIAGFNAKLGEMQTSLTSIELDIIRTKPALSTMSKAEIDETIQRFIDQLDAAMRSYQLIIASYCLKDADKNNWMNATFLERHAKLVESLMKIKKETLDKTAA